MVSSTHEHHDWLRKKKFAAPVRQADVEADWRPRGFSCQEFVDPPGGHGAAATLRALHPSARAQRVIYSALQSRCMFTAAYRLHSAHTQPRLSCLLAGAPQRAFRHASDELIVLVSGSLEVVIGGDRVPLQVGRWTCPAAGYDGGGLGRGPRYWVCLLLRWPAGGQCCALPQGAPRWRQARMRCGKSAALQLPALAS